MKAVNTGSKTSNTMHPRKVVIILKERENLYPHLTTAICMRALGEFIAKVKLKAGL